MAFGDVVTLINRTSKPLTVRYDGIDYTIEPGENPAFPRVMVKYAKDQNPLMGSEHPFDPNRFVSLVGVKGTKDDCAPIEQSSAPQRIDRSDERERGKISKQIRGDGPTTFDMAMPGSLGDTEGGGFTGRVS